jgi:hypothetical protein
MAIAGLKNLCTPSYVYLLLSTIALVIMAVQNYGNINVYCLGSYSCVVSSTLLIFLIKIIYVLFWTWILNLMCRAGATTFSWLLVLFPFILFLAIIFVSMIGK